MALYIEDTDKTVGWAYFEGEFKALTTIGNSFRIRNHETDKIDIADGRHFDYIFSRCMSLIVSALQYLN